MARSLDRTFAAGLIALIGFTPLAMGAVHPPAYALVEAIVFLLVLVFVARQIVAGPITIRYREPLMRTMATPLLLFLCLCALQLLPLPPSALRAVSPSTYSVYTHTLPGWPQTSLYSRLHDRTQSEPVILPSSDEVRAGATVPNLEARTSLARPPLAQNEVWRSITINPHLSAGCLLRLGAYATLFFLVLLYPLGRAAEAALGRRLAFALVVTALVVAAVALVEQATWNGKILWTIVPYDWGVPELVASGRARGPFVNPDHLAAYLNLALPLCIAGLLYPRILRTGNSDAARVLCAVAGFLCAAAILLSLSRTGWIGMFLGPAIFFSICSRVAAEDRPALLRAHHLSAGAVTVCGGALLLILAAFIGSSGRDLTSSRVADTVATQVGLPFRLNVWRDTTAVIRDFPVFGTGLDSFQDIFPHYQRPPWNAARVNAAHNDYLQLLAETGLAGALLAAWFFVSIAASLLRAFRPLSSRQIPLFAAIAGGCATIVFHETFDFALQIPAIALLLTMFIALAVRTFVLRPAAKVVPERIGAKKWILWGALAAAATVLIIVALAQNRVPYPYEVVSASPTEAVERIVSAPTDFAAHAELLELAGREMSADQRLAELGAAAWLNPNHPAIRDAIAQTLLSSERRAAALEQLEVSTYNAPALSQHGFLRRRLIPWLGPAERAAIRRGLSLAAARRFPEAVESLSAACWVWGDYSCTAQAYEQAAAGDQNATIKAHDLTEAGYALKKQGDDRAARARWQLAIAAAPSFTPAYAALIANLVEVQHDPNGASFVVAQGLTGGASAADMYKSLADAAAKLDDTRAAEAALLSALTYRPSDVDLLCRLGTLYSRDRAFDRAIIYFTRAAGSDPNSARTYLLLAVAQEADYRYDDADQSYARAQALDPHDQNIIDRYKAFRAHLATNLSGGRN